MHMRQRVVEFTDRYPFVGPIVWMLSTQYFFVQFFVAGAWPRAYDWAVNLISDLGNTECGQYAARYVCSPEHGVMNASFIILGASMAIGSLLIYQMFERSRGSLVGFGLMGLSGIGTVLVGVFPENSVPLMHGIGAFFALVVGNVSLLVLAASLVKVRSGFRYYTAISGTLSLIAFGLFESDVTFGLGRGGMERLVSYPQTIWLILLGLYMTSVRVRSHMVHRRSA